LKEFKTTSKTPEKIQMTKAVLIFITIILLTGCNSKKEKEAEPIKQLNISILLDLSDRINPDKHKMQIMKDSILLLNIVRNFKNFIMQKGTFAAFDKINFFFHPMPEDSETISISEQMNIDLSKLDVRSKKMIFNNLENTFATNINRLYQKTIKEGKYIGSDIYRFIKDGAYDKCVINDPRYINILIVITDGYLYFKNSLTQIKNRTTYLGPASSVLQKFRTNPNWKDLFNTGDYGFITPNVNLDNLNVLILEINPVAQFPQDFDIIKEFWSKWFLEMNVSENGLKILKTDLPNNTDKLMNDYFNNIIHGVK
jgi:hypothetical protein